jgi:D-alanyl-D-alanine endopeptidase (penicillin-binding protein 7)
MWKNFLLAGLIAVAPAISVAAEAELGVSESLSAPSISDFKAPLAEPTIPVTSKATAKRRRARHNGSLQHIANTKGEPQELSLLSSAVLVIDQEDGHSVYSKNTENILPIASITKLMTAMVILEADQDLSESVAIQDGDVDIVKNTHSRLKVGTVVRRGDLLRLALMASENRAAAALARDFPGGTAAFVAKMNEHAAELGLSNTHFVDSTGLSFLNVSTPSDLAKMVQAAYKHPLIREYSTTPGLMLTLPNARRGLAFNNTNRLVKNSDWHIGLQKTGFINESGQCLVMQANIATRSFVIVLLDAVGKYSRIGDAIRIRKWIETHVVANSLSAGPNLNTDYLR